MWHLQQGVRGFCFLRRRLTSASFLEGQERSCLPQLISRTAPFAYPQDLRPIQQESLVLPRPSSKLQDQLPWRTLGRVSQSFTDQPLDGLAGAWASPCLPPTPWKGPTLMRPWRTFSLPTGLPKGAPLRPPAMPSSSQLQNTPQRKGGPPRAPTQGRSPSQLSYLAHSLPGP